MLCLHQAFLWQINHMNEVTDGNSLETLQREFQCRARLAAHPWKRHYRGHLCREAGMRSNRDQR